MADLRNEVVRESDRINEASELSAQQHFIAGKWWRRAHFILGLAATIVAAVSSVLTYYQHDEGLLLPGVLAMLVAILAGLMTFLNPKSHADMHQSKGVEYAQIVADARMLTNLGALSERSDEELEVEVRSLNQRKIDLDRADPAAPSGYFYSSAKRAILRGGTSFRVDTTKSTKLRSQSQHWAGRRIFSSLR